MSPEYALSLSICDLHDFVALTESLGTRFRRARLPEGLSEQATRLTERLRQVAEASAGELSSHFHAAAAELAALGRELESSVPRAAELRARWRALAHTYEALHLEAKNAELALPAGRRLARLKPRNYARNLFHISSGLIGIAIYELLGQRLVVAGLAAAIFFAFILLDLGRRISPVVNEKMVERLFGAISRPHEHLHVPSAVWYVGALLVGVVWLPRPAVELGVLVLALGDPAASLVGKHFGRRRLFGEKTLEGSLAFVGASLVFGVLLLSLVAPELGGWVILRMSVGAALAGALAELYSGPLDDNLTVPLAASAAAALLL
ncbi:MAG: SEC59/DGK1/VTE5 family protein [Deltaproteobacteria bacterium]|nr:SEC59/DGK1/VTE5 family protein [Deltaproteobacteria bacterium]